MTEVCLCQWGDMRLHPLFVEAALVGMHKSEFPNITKGASDTFLLLHATVFHAVFIAQVLVNFF